SPGRTWATSSSRSRTPARTASCARPRRPPDGCGSASTKPAGKPLRRSPPTRRLRREKTMYVEAIAPSRIDLAGGTLDIYPLYLFEEGGLTVNIGIDVGSRARLRSRPDARVTIRS